MDQIKLIVALGNPGNSYTNTRHNAAWWFMDMLSDELRLNWKDEKRYFAQVSSFNINNIEGNRQEIKLIMPQTFMNLSGKAVGAIANFYRILPNEILVIHDELDLKVGQVKLKQGGGHGGHNGLKDIISALANNKNFYRLRLGIGHPGDKNLVVNYVLNTPPLEERKLIEQTFAPLCDGVRLLLTQGLSKAQNQINAINFTA